MKHVCYSVLFILVLGTASAQNNTAAKYELLIARSVGLIGNWGFYDARGHAFRNLTQLNDSTYTGYIPIS